MIKIFFLLILVSIQGGNPLIYKGFMGYDSYEECMAYAVRAENYMMEIEMRRGLGDERAVWIKSYCIPFDIFVPKNLPSVNGDPRI